MENKVLKPKIRFKGFADTWEQRKLKDLVKNVGTGKSKYELSECNKYPVLGSRNIIGFDNSYDYWGDFILTARVGEYAGELYRYKGKAKITDNTVYLQGDNLNYLFYLLKNYNLKKLSFGSGQPLIKASELSNLDLKVTDNVREKEKISNLFINLDNLITLHQSKYDKLVNVKKALLEKMFPKDGKNVPEIRFKGFTDTWEQRKLTEFVEFFNGQTYSPSNVQENGTLVLRSSNVQNGEITKDDSVYIDNKVVNTDNVKIGDIIVVVRNGSRNLIGKHAQIKLNMPNTVIGAFMTGIRTKNSNFVNSLLNTPIFEEEISKNMGATINQITGYMFSNMEFKIPSDKEQEQIGKLFNELDNLITLHQHKLEKLKNMKKSLLNKMFI